MRVGVFADCHDHLDHIRKVVIHCNQAEYDLVLFAGDLVSTFAIPPLRKLKPRFIGCFGDNEGNKIGIYGGMQIIGTFGEPPFGIELADGTQVLLTHQKELSVSVSADPLAPQSLLPWQGGALRTGLCERPE